MNVDVLKRPRLHEGQGGSHRSRWSTGYDECHRSQWKQGQETWSYTNDKKNGGQLNLISILMPFHDGEPKECKVQD